MGLEQRQHVVFDSATARDGIEEDVNGAKRLNSKTAWNMLFVPSGKITQMTDNYR